LFVGAKDALTVAKDFKTLKGLLPDGISVENIGDYNHLDYMWAEDADKFVNEKVLDYFSAMEF